MDNKEYDDCLTADEFKELERSQEQVLSILYAKVRDSDDAKAWLNTSLGKSFRIFVAADKMRAMKTCAKEHDPVRLKKAQFDHAVVCKMESVFGSIIVDGQEALQQLTQMQEGDTNE